MADPPLFLHSKHQDLLHGLFACVSDLPLPEDAAKREVNRVAAEMVNAKKEQNKAKKERVKL